MKIDWVIPCRYVEVHDNLATIVGAGGDRFVLSEEPWVLEIMLAIRVTALVEELGPDNLYPVENKIRDPEGNAIHEEEGSFSATARGDIHDPTWLQGVFIATQVKFPAEVEGTYTIAHVFGNSEHLLPLHISHAAATGAEPNLL
jgi:hypothetical protein